MASLFDEKIFNGEVFAKYVDTVQDLNKNELIKSGVLNDRTSELKARFADQVGGNYQTVPIKGLIDGDALNYDGNTDITATSRKTYMQNMIVVGRAKAWVEKDFSSDITGGEDFMPMATEVAQYWQNVDQNTLLSVLKGVFAMTGGKNAEFVDLHTTDISAEGEGKFSATTLNTAMQKALGDNKAKFGVAIMHSAVATNLENLQLLEYLKYTDANGIQRDLTMGTVNGRIVLIDDSMPAETGDDGTTYTTYVLGTGAIDYGDFGATVPYEMGRDASTNGGQTTLYSRQRKMFAPHGISFAPTTVPLSPTNAQLENGANWTLVHDGSKSNYISHKEIPIARIISKG